MEKSLNKHKYGENKKLVVLPLVLLLAACTALAYPNGLPPDSYREIVVDAPWRVESNVTEIPLFVFINDAYVEDKTCPLNPLCVPYRKIFTLHNITVYQDLVQLKVVDFQYHQDILDDNYGLVYKGSWIRIFNISVWPSERGRVIPFTVVVDGTERICGYGTAYDVCVPNNLDPIVLRFNVTVANEYLPKITENYFCGDTHLHSMYTDNAVPEFNWPANMGEIGAPVNATIAALKAMGLKWTIITDHSDDYTDIPGFTSSFDNPNAKSDKWPRFKAECSNYTLEKTGFTCIPGEEVTCTSHDGVGGHHLLAYDIQERLPGYLVSSRLLGHKMLCPDAIQNITSQGGISFAAHPIDKAPPLINFLQQWPEDYYTLPFNGFEVWNTKEALYTKNNLLESEFKLEYGLRRYDKYLSDHPEQRKFIITGSDAHGDLNKNLAKPMTCCYMDSPTKENVLNALASGKCILTSGPALKFFASSTDSAFPTDMADTLSMLDDENLTLTLQWKSTPEFGGINYVEFVKDGRIVDSSNRSDSSNGSRVFTDSVSWGLHRLFYRAWVNTSRGERAYTNPIWVNVFPALKNQLYNLSFVVVNDGLGGAGGFTVELWRGVKDSPSGVRLFSESVSGLVSGESRRFSFVWLADVNGSVEFNAYAVYGGNEVSKGDNSAWNRLLVTLRSYNLSALGDSATMYEPYPVNINANLVSNPYGGVSQFTIGRYVDYTADKQFRKALIRVYYNPAGLNGIPEELYNLNYWDSSQRKWVPLDVTYRNTTGHYLEAYTPHFSTFTAIGEARADLNITGLVVSAANVSEYSMVNLSATVRNEGVMQADGIVFAFYGVQGYGMQQIYNTTLAALGVGSQVTLSYMWNVSNSTGYYDIYAVAALVNASEYREYDNAAYGNLTVYHVPVVWNCSSRATCDECIRQPYAEGERCRWDALDGICMNVTDKCSFCTAGANDSCFGACFLDYVYVETKAGIVKTGGSRPALFVDDVCADASGLANLSWVSYEPVQWACDNNSGSIVCDPPNLTKAPEQFNATLLSRREVSVHDIVCMAIGCPYGSSVFALVPAGQASLFTSNGYTLWSTQPASLYSGSAASNQVGGLVLMAGGPYVADSGGVRISGALSYELGGSIVSYGWDINNDNVTDYNQSTVKLTLQELQDKELIEASANSITLEVTDDLGAKSKTTTEIRIPYAWSSIITSTSTTFTSTTTTTSTTSTSTTSTTLPLIKDICLGGDLSVVGFAGVIPHC